MKKTKFILAKRACKRCGDFKRYKNSHCVTCNRIDSKKFKEDNPTYHYDRIAKDRKGAADKQREWHKLNPDYKRNWNANNKDKKRFSNSLYRANKTKAMVKWHDKEFERNKHKLHTELSALFDERFSLDHIIPLNHAKICGLHCSDNMQTLVGFENSMKSNSWDGTYENDGWRLR